MRYAATVTLATGEWRTFPAADTRQGAVQNAFTSPGVRESVETIEVREVGDDEPQDELSKVEAEANRLEAEMEAIEREFISRRDALLRDIALIREANRQIRQRVETLERRKGQR